MYTWGQIRLLLQQQFACASLDTIDAAINGRYALILSLLDWRGLIKTSTIESAAVIRTGTVSATQGSATVTGSGTNWTDAISGMQFLAPGSSALYTATYMGPETLALDRPYEGNSFIDGGYTLLQSIYKLPGDCRTLRVIKSPVTGVALDEWTETEFAALVGFPTLQGVAAMYRPAPDLVDAATGYVTAQRIQLYPLPTEARGYPIAYEQAAAGFDGVNTSAAPLPFVSDAALLAGCKADLELAKEQPDLARAASFEQQFEAHFTGMVRIDSKQRAHAPARMNPIYTKHRTERILRGFGGSVLCDRF